MNFQIIQMISIGVVTQAVLFIFFLVSNKKKNSCNRQLLAALLSVYVFLIAASFVLVSRRLWFLFRIAHLVNQTAFLIGPISYLYIQSFFNPKLTLKKKDMLHGIPFFIVIIYLVIKFYFIKIYITCQFNEVIIGTALFIQYLIYFILSLNHLKKNGLSLRVFLTERNNPRTGWLRFFIFGSLIIWMVKLLFFIIWDATGQSTMCPYPLHLYFLTLFFFFNLFVYFGLKMPGLFLGTSKYENSIINDDDKNHYKERLVTLMEKEKLFLDPTLSLSSLAKRITIPPRYLSQVINESFKQSYYDYINHYRIQESMRMLKDESCSDKTILEIMYAVGFNSKSTFNTIFKKETGLTPKAYRSRKL